MDWPDLKHPISNLDATFAATKPEDTYRLMEALRNAGIYFDVSVNGPKDDLEGQSYDVFWFQKDDDQKFIASIIRAVFSKSVPNS